jgi:4'-phosphopantetheinyl transferase
MQVYWLEQTEADVPLGNDWMGASERRCLEDLRFPKRRADWRLGRWTAKRALAGYWRFPAHPDALAAIEIRPAPSGAPEVFVSNEPASVTISLSHRAGRAACAVAQPNAALGCDLEINEQRSEAFLADYFTIGEQALVARAAAADRPRLVTLFWSGKESALKALRTGLRLDTRSVAVVCVNMPQGRDTWRPLHVRCDDGAVFYGWWRETGSLLRTLVAAPKPDMPILIPFREQEVK